MKKCESAIGSGEGVTAQYWDSLTTVVSYLKLCFVEAKDLNCGRAVPRDYLTLRIKVAWGLRWAESAPLTATLKDYIFVASYLHF